MPDDRIFLERRNYRMRRMLDVVRLLPVLGLALWMVPLLWPLQDSGTAPMPMSAALLYLFGVWALLIVIALVLWRRTAPSTGPSGDASVSSEAVEN